MRRDKTVCLALVGPSGAGKSTVGSLLAATYGWLHFEAASEFGAICPTWGHQASTSDVERSQQADILLRELGADAVAASLVDKLNTLESQVAVISGFRFCAETRLLARAGHRVTVIRLDAPLECRLNRIALRHRPGSPGTVTGLAELDAVRDWRCQCTPACEMMTVPSGDTVQEVVIRLLTLIEHLGDHRLLPKPRREAVT
jgi:adenylate kinase family enzyme